MSALRRLLPTHQPQEVNFFLFLAAFALTIGVIYWFASAEPAGTLLLLGFGVATGAIGVRLAIDPAARAARRQAALDAARPAPARATDADAVDPGGEGPTSGGTGGLDRPFLDESGRLPGETFAPFAMGAGVAIAATGVIFGIAPVLVGLIPLAWGAWAWIAGASAELEATEAEGRLGR